MAALSSGDHIETELYSLKTFVLTFTTPKQTKILDNKVWWYDKKYDKLVNKCIWK